MGVDSIMQFPAEEDGCVYFYDEKREIWKKICDIKSPAELPQSVRKQVNEARETILKLPL